MAKAPKNENSKNIVNSIDLAKIPVKETARRLIDANFGDGEKQYWIRALNDADRMCISMLHTGQRDVQRPIESKSGLKPKGDCDLYCSFVTNSPDDSVGVNTPAVHHLIHTCGYVYFPPFSTSPDPFLRVLKNDKAAQWPNLPTTVGVAPKLSKGLPIGDGDHRSWEIAVV